MTSYFSSLLSMPGSSYTRRRQLSKLRSTRCCILVSLQAAILPLLGCYNFHRLPSCNAFSPMLSIPPSLPKQHGSIFSFSTPPMIRTLPAGRQYTTRARSSIASLFAHANGGEPPVNGGEDDAGAMVDDARPPALPKGRSDEEVFRFVEEASAAERLYYLDTVIIGAGPAGIGVAHALLRGGMAPSSIVLIDKERSVGSSFLDWHNTTRFISPSWAGYPFGVQDLNAVVPDTTVCAAGGESSAGQQHPTGQQYASYLERMVNGTNLVCLFGERVISIERRAKQGCFVIQSRNDQKDGDCVFIANYVVWAGGEWNSPRLPPPAARGEEGGAVVFAKDATVHYKHANVEALLRSRRSDDDRIVLIGGGEAGADLGVALANRGARVLIVEESRDGDDGEQLDPSRKLSPITIERLANAGDNIDFRTGTKCTEAHRNGDTVTVTLDRGLAPAEDTRTAFPKPTTETVTTGADAVLCTGFDPSQNPLLKDLFEWNKEGLPVVTPANDESTITKNLFLAGPSLMHQLACKEEDSNDGDDANDDVDDDSKNIIFCFVYKYRTRFAVVASAIIQRYMEDQQLKLQAFYDTPVEEMDENVKTDLVSADEIAEILVKKKNMQAYYRSKGFLLTDLSCAQLACGMTGNDAPRYDYADDSSCCASPGGNKGEETECATC